MCVMHNIHVQKIKIKKHFFRYILHLAWELFVYFHILYNIQKALPSGGGGGCTIALMCVI